jgi:cell division protein FtsB
MNRRLKNWLILGVGLLVIWWLGKDLVKLINQNQRLEDLEKRYEEAKTENEYLLAELNWVGSDEFIEEEARNKLGLGKEGEVFLVLPEGIVNRQQAIGNKADEGESNWRAWLELFVAGPGLRSPVK